MCVKKNYVVTLPYYEICGPGSRFMKISVLCIRPEWAEPIAILYLIIRLHLTPCLHHHIIMTLTRTYCIFSRIN